MVSKTGDFNQFLFLIPVKRNYLKKSQKLLKKPILLICRVLQKLRIYAQIRREEGLTRYTRGV